MKKRIACLLLTLVMIVSLIPTAAIRTSAAGLTVSEAGIRVIKDYMGFHKTAYKAADGSFKIGYGTPSVEGATITEANADLYLREQLKNLEDNVLNNSAYITATLVQKRFDALAWYSYVEGLGWTSSSVFKNAVNGNVSSTALADAMCTWDFDAGYSVYDPATSDGILTRRLAMANLYLRGSYSSADTGSLSFTVFDAGEGAYFSNGARKVVMAFDGSTMSRVLSTKSTALQTPTFGVAKFLGWYSGNSMVTGVGSSTARQTLVARWQVSDDKIAASYTLPACVIYEASGTPDNAFVTVYNDPLLLQKIDVVNRDATVTVIAEKIVGSDKWLQLATGGWVRLCSSIGDVPVIIPAVTVTITDDYVNIRELPSANAKKVGTARRGETRTIAMLSSDLKWCYCSEGWIFLAYTNYNDKSSGSGSNLGTGVTGVVTGAAKVNVRTAPGVSSPLATQLSEGTKITVYEQATAENAAWGHIDQGWIYMGYVKLDQSTASGSAISTGGSGVVSSSVNLAIRSGAGTGYTKVGTLAPGTSVVILRKQVVDGVTWGLIDQGWINMNYVSASLSSSGGSVNGVAGTVVNCASGVNIRSAAGPTNALVGVAALGSRVTITERVMVNGFYWGHMERGWVCMDYIQLDSEFVEPSASNPATPDNVVTSFNGYPAVTIAVTELRETASSDAKSLLTLNNGVDINILARTIVGERIFGKVTIGSKTGWVNLDDVKLIPVDAKVTAAKADAYELPSTRSKFYASLVKDTALTIGNSDGSGWKLADGILWGQTKFAYAGVEYIGWIKMSDVTMFKDNTKPTGITTLNGVGYLTGTINTGSAVYQDKNGDVVLTPTAYSVVAGNRVNILARNFDGLSTWAKITVGSVTGWIPMSCVTLDPVVLQVKQDVKGFTALTDVPNGPFTTIPAGAKLTVTERVIIPDSNEINHGLTDVGYVYVGDNTSLKYYVILDEGRLANTTAAVVEEAGNPAVVIGVAVTGTAPAGLTIYEEAIDTSKQLLKMNSASNITVLNWKLVDGVTWGKVQIGKIVGWIKIDSSISFAGLTGTVAVPELRVYNTADKNSSVQILRVNNRAIDIDPALIFDGTTLWGKISVDAKTGWIDLANVTLSTPGAVYAPEFIIARATINSVDATINVADTPNGADGKVTTLPKGTAVDLIKVQIDAGEAWWLVDMADKDGWVRMDCLNMGAVTARITEASAPIYDDLVTAALPGAKILDNLYRDETINIRTFKMQGGNLYGEVAYGNTTGWIQICIAPAQMKVSLTPGSTGTVSGGSTSASTAPTTAPAATSVPAYIVCNSTVNVRSGAGVEYGQIGTMTNGTVFNITAQATNATTGKVWAQVDGGGWVCMDYVRMGTATGGSSVPTGGSTAPVGAPSSPVILTSVPGGAMAVGFAEKDLTVYGGAGFGYGTTGTIPKNTGLIIYEKQLSGGVSWARTDRGWIILSYVVVTGIGAPGTGTSGTIARCGYTAHIRASGNFGSTELGKVMISSPIMIHETVNGWARTDLGWISTDYIVTAADAAPVPGGTVDTGSGAPDSIPADSGVSDVG